MSSPSSPIDDGTPMNAPAGASSVSEPNGEPAHLVNGAPLFCSDDNPENDQPQDRRSRVRHPLPVNDDPSRPPASPMHQDDEDPASPNGAAVSVDEDMADARGNDKPDALPKLFRPSGASPAGDAEAGKRSKGSVEAWSATDVYALPPVYPSMGKVSRVGVGVGRSCGTRRGFISCVQ